MSWLCLQISRLFLLAYHLCDTGEVFYYRIQKNVLKIVRMVYCCWFALLSKPQIVLFFSGCYFSEYVKEMCYLCVSLVQHDFLSCLIKPIAAATRTTTTTLWWTLLVKLRKLDKGNRQGYKNLTKSIILTSLAP